MAERYKLFSGLILSISRSLQKIKNVEMPAFGMKGKQVECLFALYHTDNGATLTELCELCDEDKGAMSRTVKELAALGYVHLPEDGAKHYRQPIKLTVPGQQLAKKVADKIADIFAVCSQGIAEPERTAMYATLGQVADNLTRICANYGAKNA